MPRITPGHWYDVFAGPLLAGSGTTTIAIIPGGRNLYLDWLSFSVYGTNAIPGPELELYVAADGVPLLVLVHGRLAADVTFPKPQVITSSIIAGSFGPRNEAKNLVVCFSGDCF